MAVVQSKHATASSADYVIVTLDAATTAGHPLVLVGLSEADDGVSDDKGNTYTRVATNAHADNGTASIWVCLAPTAGAQNFGVSGAGWGFFRSLYVIELDDDITSVDVAAQTTSYGLSISLSITPTTDGVLIGATYGQSGTYTIADGSSSIGTQSAIRTSIVTRRAVTSGATAFEVTGTSNSNWQALAVALSTGGGSSVTVDLDATEPADTAAVTGRVEWLCILDATEPADVAAVVLQGEILAELAGSEAPDTAAVALTAEWLLTLAATEAQDTLLVNLSDAVLVTLDATEPADGFSGSLTSEWLLTLATTEAPDTASGALLSEWLLTLAATESPDTAAALGWLETFVWFERTEAGDQARIVLEIEGAGPIIHPAVLWLRVNGVVISARRERIREWGA